MGGDTEPVIHTAGLGGRSLEVLLDLLRRARVRRVVDIRRYPSAERFPHLDAGALHPVLREAGLDVVDMGDALGGDRPGGFPRYMASPPFARAFTGLQELAREAPTLLLCAEREPARCHRRFIADSLEARGWTVVHHVWTPRERAARGELRLLRFPA